MSDDLVREFIFRPGSIWPSAHAASILALPTGNLMASWFAGTREGAPDVGIWGAEMTKEGWSAPHALAVTSGRPDGNSVLWLDDAGSVRLWYVTMEGKGWATCPVRERRSSDEGQTWGPDRYIRREPGWMVRNEPLHWNGRLLMPMYDERDWSAFVLISDDGGDSWTHTDSLRSKAGIIQPALAPLGDGRLLMLLRSRGGALYRSYCPDESGRQWSAPEATSLPNPNSAVELIALETGALPTVFNPTRRGRSPLRVALSDDGGAHWDAWRDLETEPG